MEDKKDNIDVSISEEEENVVLTSEQIFDVLEFARQAYSGVPGIFTPDLINSRMQDVNLNPLKGTQEEIEKALNDPKNNEEQLIGYSEFFELTSMIYKRMLYYMSHLLSFTVKDIICLNAKNEEDYTKNRYVSDYEILCNFLDEFNIKQELSKVMRELLRKDASFWVLRKDTNKYTLQELPHKYCKITGRWDYGLLFDFDMSWFDQIGVDINMYPPIFKDMQERTSRMNSGEYNPNADLRNRTGTYSKWTQTSPEDGFWAWKMTPELSTTVPFLAPLFQDVVLQPLIRKLQTNKYMIEATKVMIGLIPMMKDPKGAQVKDMVALSSESAGKFLNLIKKGVGDVIKTGAAPFEDVKVLDFEGSQRNMLEDYSKTTTAMSGINSRLIYSSDKPNILETELSLDVDVMTISYMYSYFEDFLSYYINKLTKKYKFKIVLDGINTSENRKKRREEFTTYAAMGVVLPDRLAYSLDILPHHLIKQMEKAKAMKFNEKLLPMMNMYTNQNIQEDNNGRPQKDSSDLSESGSQSRESDGLVK